MYLPAKRSHLERKVRATLPLPHAVQEGRFPRVRPQLRECVFHRTRRTRDLAGHFYLHEERLSIKEIRAARIPEPHFPGDDECDHREPYRGSAEKPLHGKQRQIGYLAP